MKGYPECFVPKCRDCEYKEFCLSRKNGDHALPTPPLPLKVKVRKPWHLKPAKQQKYRGEQKRGGKRGKKLKDMTIEEKRAVWREYAAAKKAKAKPGVIKKKDSDEEEEAEDKEEESEETEDNDSVSNEKLERMEKLGKKIKKMEEDLEGLPERP